MKRIIISIAIMFAAVSSSYVSAQLGQLFNGTVHGVSGYVGGGLSSIRYEPTIGEKSSGAGVDFGAGYTCYWLKDYVATSGIIYQMKIGIHTGVGLSFNNASTSISNDKTTANDLRDSDDDRFNLETIFAGYKESQNVILLNIPVMVEYHFDKYFVMGGLKFGIPVSSKYSSEDANLKNRAYYPDFDNWLETQTFAGYGEFKGKNMDGKVDLGVSVMLALEGGMKWRIKTNQYIYTGIYFDYGLNNINKETGKPFIVYNNNTPKDFTTNSVLTSMTESVKTIAFGVKVRYAFELSKK